MHRPSGPTWDGSPLRIADREDGGGVTGAAVRDLLLRRVGVGVEGRRRTDTPQSGRKRYLSSRPRNPRLTRRQMSFHSPSNMCGADWRGFRVGHTGVRYVARVRDCTVDFTSACPPPTPAPTAPWTWPRRENTGHPVVRTDDPGGDRGRTDSSSWVDTSTTYLFLYGHTPHPVLFPGTSGFQ